MINTSNIFRIKKNLFTKIFLIIGFLITWGSLSSGMDHFTQIFNSSEINFNILLNFARSGAILFYFPCILIFLINFYAKVNFKIQNNWFFVLIASYFLLQLPGLFLTDNKIINFYYLISALNVIIILHMASKIFNKKEIKLFYYISLLFIISIFIFYFKSDLSKFLFFNNSFYGSWNGQSLLLNLEPPRAGGMSRMALLILIMLTYLTINSLNRNIIYLLIIFFSTSIILYQARTTIGLLFILVILEFFLMKNYNFKSIIIKASVYLIIPFFLSYSVSSYKLKKLIDYKILVEEIVLVEKKLLISKNNSCLNVQLMTISDLQGCILSMKESNKKLINEKAIKKTMDKLMVGCKELDFSFLNHRKCEKFVGISIIRQIPVGDFSSNRFEDWNTVIKLFFTNNNINFTTKLFGYGSQGDRFKIGQTISNGILYSLLTSGYIGMLFFIFLSIYILFLCFNYLLTDKLKLSNKSNHPYFIILIIIIARSSLESSYAVFGIDFIMLNVVITTLQTNYTSNPLLIKKLKIYKKLMK